MLRDAPILLLDEPTTGLDANSTDRVIEPLRRLMAGRATIIISHNLSTVREATSIIVLDQGHIVERGTHTELVRLKGLYAELWRSSGLEQTPEPDPPPAPDPVEVPVEHPVWPPERVFLRPSRSWVDDDYRDYLLAAGQRG